MSDINLARRTDIEVYFAGVDITQSLQKYLLSLTYTDNEEDETDDLQIKLHDRSGIWLEDWLNTTIQSASELEKEDVIKQYKVIAKGGLAIRSGTESKSKTLGTLAYGTIITVKEIKDGWVNFKHSVVEDGKTTEKTAYVEEKYLQPVYKNADDKSTSSATVQTVSTSDWNIGDEVSATGRPQQSSYGTGTAGTAVSNYKGTITHLNLKSGIPYPIHVGQLGWFAISQIQKVGGAVVATAENAEDEASKGLKIQAAIVRKNWHNDGVDERMECGQFELDSINASGPPATITIKGTSLPYSSTIRQTKKSKSWENYALSGIANEIAETNGMTCMFLAKDIQYTRVEQYCISDIAFLQKLCQDAGFSLKITNNNIVIFDQTAYESKPIIKTIKHGKEGGYTNYKLNTSSNDTYTSCHVSYVTPEGTVIEATAYADKYVEREKTEDKTVVKFSDGGKNQCLEIRQKVESVAEALTLAKKSLRLHNKYEFTGSFTFPGDPELLAGCTVELEGWGAWDAKYIIKQAKHTVSNSGYTTQITLRRALLSKDDVEVDAETLAEITKTIDELAREVIRGDWGNGEERRRRLTEAGYDYNAVQKRVNELLR